MNTIKVWIVKTNCGCLGKHVHIWAFFFVVVVLSGVHHKCLSVKHVQHCAVYTSASHRQSSWYWINANKARKLFWFQPQNKKKTERKSACFPVSSVLLLESQKDFKISKSHATALSFNRGWSSKPCSSSDRGKVNSLHRAHAGMCEETAAWPNLCGNARVGRKKRYSLLAINSNIW